MGNWWSGEQRNIPMQPVSPAVDVRALKAYDDYITGLSSLKFYTDSFTFSHFDASGLKKDEFHSLLDHHRIPKEKRFGQKASYVYVMHQEAGKIQKSLLIFVRSTRNEEEIYDVLVAEVQMETGLNKTRMVVAAGTCVLVSGALCLLNPALGLLSGALCTVVTAGKVVYEKDHHDFKDVTIGYMIRQLIEAKNLTLTTRGELALYHNGQETLLRNTENEDPDADDTEIVISVQS